MIQGIRLAVVALAALLLTACGTTVKEVHYFASYDSNGKPTEFFRLTVSGSAQMSGAKFQSGYYDERALDLFFNQIGADGKAPDNGKNILRCPAEGSCDLSLASLNPDEHGAYMLILSTDADAVANAVGTFAGNEAVAEAVTNMVNKDAIKQHRKASAAVDRQTARGGRTAAGFRALQAQAAAAPDGPSAQTAYLRALGLLAHYLGGDGAFSSMAEAKAWFAGERATSNREAGQ